MSIGHLNALVAEHLGQSHEGDEVEELGGGILEVNLAAVTARGQLQPTERIDRHRVRRDLVNVAKQCLGTAFAHHRANPPPEPRKILPRNRAADGEADDFRPGCAHVRTKTARDEETHRSGAMSFPRRPRHT